MTNLVSRNNNCVMLIIVKVCVFLTAFATALAEYLPIQEYVYHPYEQEYAPEYNNYVSYVNDFTRKIILLS